MVLLGLVLWTGPVFGASIQKVVDQQGVIRITNVKPRTISAPDSAANTPAPPEAPSPVATVPPEERAISPKPASPEPLPPSTVSRAHSPAGSTSRDETSPGNGENHEVPFPVKKAAFPAPEPSAPPPGKAALSSKNVNVTPGGIRRYRDDKGAWHIENVTSEPPDNSPAKVQNPILKVSGTREGGFPEILAAPGLPAIKKASLSDGPPLRPPRNPPPEEGAIRRYRDPKGVLHITNLSGPPKHPHQLASPAEARSWSPRDGPVLKPPRPTPAVADPPLAITTASWEDGALPVERRSPQFPAPPAEVGVPGQIKRYRDAKGVLHLHTVEPELPPLPQGPLARPRSLLSQAFALSPPQKAGGWANPPALAPPGGQVVAYKDKQGRLIIQNPDPHTLANRGPPRGQPSPYLQAVILEAAQTHGLPPPLIEAVIKVESNSVPWAVSPKGAMGLMQLMPGTAEFLGVKDPFCPRENVLGGTRYLRLLLNLFQESLPLALAAYNAGYQRVINCGYQVPEIKETQDFVTQVMGRYYLAAKRANQPRL
ncbi:MAG: hypothetical protein FJ134_10875 [Deltaproteobacteria bacterium]|nr:hypothetical protein [Deltaproteobacteria bacterium]